MVHSPAIPCVNIVHLYAMNVQIYETWYACCIMLTRHCIENLKLAGDVLQVNL